MLQLQVDVVVIEQVKQEGLQLCYWTQAALIQNFKSDTLTFWNADIIPHQGFISVLKTTY